MESTTYLKNIRIAPKKLRFFIQSIKRMTPAEAVKVLLYSHEKPSQVFYKSIRSAIANAKQTLKVGDDLLQFKTLTVEEGQKMRRYRPGGRGTARMIHKRSSHIKIILVAKEGVEIAKEEPKKAIEAEVKPTEEAKEEKPKVKRTVTRKKKAE